MKLHLLAGIVGATVALVPANATIQGDKRVALVIGIGAYSDSPLSNPVNDARAIGEALRTMNFDVTEVDDGRKDQILAALDKVRLQLDERRAPTALLYFAGHGVQLNWRNYLVPAEANLHSAADAPDRAILVDDIIGAFTKSGSATTIVVLDSCRDNPFSDSASGKGLAQMDAPVGTFLAYATAPGNVASDGSGSHGLYTEKLLQEIQRDGSPIEDVFKRVRLEVRLESGGQQVPWESTSLENDFYFRPPASRSRRTSASESAELEAELKDWDTLKNSDKAEDYAHYLGRYPSGFFAEAAQFRLDHLQAPRVRPQSSPVRVATGGEDASLEKVESLASGVNRYHVGDVFDRQVTDGWTGKIRMSRQVITFADDKTVEFNGGSEVHDQMGNVLKNRYGEFVPFVNLFPADLAVGKVWRTAYKDIGHPDIGVIEDYYDFRVVGREYVTVPAGRFLTYKIEGKGYARSSNHSAYPFDTVRWVDPQRFVEVKTIVRQGPIQRPDEWSIVELVKFTPGPAPAAPIPTPAATDSTAIRLQKLNQLLRDGLITQQEYDAKRQEILRAL